MVVTPDSTPNVKVNELVSNFFESEFNSDLTAAIPALFSARTVEAMFENWEKETAKDRYFQISDKIEYKDFPEKNRTVKVVMEALLSEGE